MVCSYVDLNVYEGYLLSGVFKGEFDCGVDVVHEILFTNKLEKMAVHI